MASAVVVFLIVFCAFLSLVLTSNIVGSPDIVTVTSVSPSLPAWMPFRHRQLISVNDSVYKLLSKTRSLTPFWASTGLCPPEPRNASGLFLLSRNTLMNLELIASLTKRAVKHVRVHWLLELLHVTLHNGSFRCNFTELDSFLDYLNYFELHPAFELMGVPAGAQEMPSFKWEDFWTGLVQQLVKHYANRYGMEYVAGCRFESWNEPDLRSYNMLNFSVSDYLTYVNAIRRGLDRINEKLTAKISSENPTVTRMVGANTQLRFYGPAGLFKAEDRHPFCWTIMSLCNDPSLKYGCPFDVLTFHRKGSGRWASEVVEGGRQLMGDIFTRFPNVNRFEFANDEADPISGWSTARPFQADVRYAAMLFSIVAQHWSAMANASDPVGQRFSFISNDNAFLSYHPYEFEQRTLLARFQMNETTPAHVQFVAKPVYSALGMLGRLGPRATATRFLRGNVSYIVSLDDQSPDQPTYLCLLASRSNDSMSLTIKRSHFNVTISLAAFNGSTGRMSYLVESLQAGRNDPFRVWKRQGRPSYPTTAELAAMRARQFPTVLNKGGKPQAIRNASNELKLSLNLRGPWIVSVRVCRYGNGASLLGPVHKLRLRKVFKDEVLVFWSLPRSGNERCIFKYEVWFKPSATVSNHWRMINDRQYTPFTHFQFVATGHCEGQNGTLSVFNNRACSSGVNGYYKVRAIDILNQPGDFSLVVRYDENDTDYY